MDIDRELVVEPRLEGKPAPTFEVEEVLVTPDKVHITGPASRVSALEKASTEGVSVEGRRESFDVPHATVYLSDPKIEVLAKVNVHVTNLATENSKPKTREVN